MRPQTLTNLLYMNHMQQLMRMYYAYVVPLLTYTPHAHSFLSTPTIKYVMVLNCAFESLATVLS